MSDIHLHLAAVLEKLPIAIGLVSSSGRLVGKAGGMADILGDTVPSHDAREARRWSFTDARGHAIPPSQWPSARALRGERNYAGMIGKLHDGDERAIKVVCIPTLQPDSDIAAVTFVQVLDTRSSSVDGSHLDLQQRLIDNLVQAVAAGWRAPTFTAA